MLLIATGRIAFGLSSAAVVMIKIGIENEEIINVYKEGKD
jgi:hypothetical protein